MKLSTTREADDMRSEISVPYCDSDSSVFQPIASRYIKCATAALYICVYIGCSLTNEGGSDMYIFHIHK